jgi:hypothetical protein
MVQKLFLKRAILMSEPITKFDPDVEDMRQAMERREAMQNQARIYEQTITEQQLKNQQSLAIKADELNNAMNKKFCPIYNGRCQQDCVFRNNSYVYGNRATTPECRKK